eukprot:2060239-Alexandrium_andersonii.AAC.1
MAPKARAKRSSGVVATLPTKRASPKSDCLVDLSEQVPEPRQAKRLRRRNTDEAVEKAISDNFA